MVQKDSNDFVLLAGTEKLYQTLSSSEARPTIALNTAQHLKVLVVVVVIVSDSQPETAGKNALEKEQKQLVYFGQMCASEKEKGPLPNLMICRSVAVENRNKLTQNQIELNSQADKKGQKLEERKKEFAIEARVSFAQNLTLIVIRDCCSSKFFSTFKRCCKLNYNHTKKFQYLTKFIAST